VLPPPSNNSYTVTRTQYFRQRKRHDEHRMAAGADLWTQPTDLSRRPAYRQPVNRIHHRHLLSLLIPKADTHFTVSRRAEGRDGLPARRWSSIQVLTRAGAE